MVMRQVVDTTDGKYIWLQFSDLQKFLSPDWISFNPTKVQDLWDWYVRYSNTHYSVLTKFVGEED